MTRIPVAAGTCLSRTCKPFCQYSYTLKGVLDPPKPGRGHETIQTEWFQLGKDRMPHRLKVKPVYHAHKLHDFMWLQRNGNSSRCADEASFKAPLYRRLHAECWNSVDCTDSPHHTSLSVTVSVYCGAYRHFVHAGITLYRCAVQWGIQEF